MGSLRMLGAARGLLLLIFIALGANGQLQTEKIPLGKLSSRSLLLMLLLLWKLEDTHNLGQHNMRSLFVSYSYDISFISSNKKRIQAVCVC